MRLHHAGLAVRLADQLWNVVPRLKSEVDTSRLTCQPSNDITGFSGRARLHFGSCIQHTLSHVVRESQHGQQTFHSLRSSSGLGVSSQTLGQRSADYYIHLYIVHCAWRVFISFPNQCIGTGHTLPCLPSSLQLPEGVLKKMFAMQVKTVLYLLNKFCLGTHSGLCPTWSCSSSRSCAVKAIGPVRILLGYYLVPLSLPVFSRRSLFPAV